MSRSGPREDLSFIEALLGLFFEPSSTIEILLSQEKPPYPFTIVACFVLSVYVPIFAQAYKYGVFVFDPNALLSLALIMLFTFLVFVLVEGVFLSLLGVEVSVRHLIAVTAYCLTPFVLALWLVYVFNYIAMGRLTLVTLLMTGLTQMDDKFMRIVPVAFLVAQLNMWIVLFFALKYLGSMHTVTAMGVTLLSLVPFYIALLIALFIGEQARPGTFEIFKEILISPLNITVYRV
ncbi:MAG: hypothetical protein K1X79_02245 [Oligoflexia bacterium]|nr:hypothetical protein [Oligoflexia bacterium]